jgi:hypothetical protein
MRRLIALWIDATSRAALRGVLGLRLPVARRDVRYYERERDDLSARLTAAVAEVRLLSGQLAMAKIDATQAAKRCAAIDARIDGLRQSGNRPEETV